MNTVWIQFCVDFARQRQIRYSSGAVQLRDTARFVARGVLCKQIFHLRGKLSKNNLSKNNLSEDNNE